MTLYEELGVPPDAAPDTIREAYRNVARVLHPDSQTNPALKESAEVQMKRINHLYEVLSDPERRRRYDAELAEADAPDRSNPIIVAPQPVMRWRGRRSGTVVWLAAAGLCAVVIAWLATRDMSAPAVYPQSANSDAPSALRKAAAAILTPSADRRKDDEIARLRAELAEVRADRDRLVSASKFQPPPIEARPTHVNAQIPSSLPPVPVTGSVRGLELPVPAALQNVPSAPELVKPRPRWSGSWAYVPPVGNGKGKTLLPPEFIETSISEDNGRIRGQYRARFKVADKRTSPDVNFRFDGTITGTSGHLSWTGVDGAEGDVQLRLISDSALEVTWSANSLGETMGLASGTAILTRRK